jgi:hypothetical protein
MKTIKFIFAFFLFATLLTSCSATSTAEDDELYSVENTQAIGEETSADMIRSRE